MFLGLHYLNSGVFSVWDIHFLAVYFYRLYSRRMGRSGCISLMPRYLLFVRQRQDFEKIISNYTRAALESYIIRCVFVSGSPVSLLDCISYSEIFASGLPNHTVQSTSQNALQQDLCCIHSRSCPLSFQCHPCKHHHLQYFSAQSNRFIRSSLRMQVRW